MVNIDTSNIIAILLFILPGVLAEKISSRMDYPSVDKTSEFKDIISGVLLSLPIVFISGAYTAWEHKVSSLAVFTAKFDDLSFLTWFIVKVGIIAILFGVIKGLTKELWINLMNWIRSVFSKMKIDNKTCWQKTFLDINKCKFLRIFCQDLVISEGFVKHYSLPNEERSVTLYIDPVLYDFPDFSTEKLFNKVISTYVDLEKNIVIKDYDMSAYDKWYENKTISWDSAEPLGKVVKPS